ncbi:hypothetical protein D9V32_15535 [Mycetocola tolaasinivorans]|uniref:Phage recombination protein Bet n=1 Tax=Mycetocola tolaasinivorans TaxID=76635 RepID=A0A3L6ZX10_9MICO|nr:recombinase RecT [Mycetocola tolaasinivorans]RLP72304.1 hypothetical protein D9V32_15535 [Mycetocola tolaasinivorans]
MSKEIALPKSVNPQTWDQDTAAMMEFAGLTWITGSGDNAQRHFAPAGITAAFLEAVRRTGLDPTARQIYAMQMGGKWTVITGIDGFRVVAHRTGEYDGQDPIEYLNTEGNWSSIPPAKKDLVAARARVYRKDLGRPQEFTVTLAEFAGKGPNWDGRPAHMLGIRAESHAFRKAFPHELSGVYTPEDAEAENLGELSPEPAAAPSEDWPALIKAAEHDRDELAAIGNRAHAAGELDEGMRLHIMRLIGAIDRAAAEAPAEPGAAPEPENVEVIEDADVPPAE